MSNIDVSLLVNGLHAYRCITINDNRSYILEQQLPGGDAFFDLFQLERLFRSNRNIINYSLTIGDGLSKSDLESPTTKCSDSNVIEKRSSFISSNPKKNSICKPTQPQILQITVTGNGTGSFIKIPIHARYPIPSTETPNGINVILPPLLLFDANGTCSYPYSDSDNIWNLPTGSLSDFYYVQLIMIFLIWFSVIAILKSLHNIKVRM